MKKFFRKYKKIITAICAVLVIVLVAGLVLNATGKLNATKEKLGIRKANPANLLDVDDYDAYDGTTVSGVKITVNDDGSITLDGTATAEIGLILAEEDYGKIVDSKFTTEDAVYQPYTHYTYSCTNDNSKIDNKVNLGVSIKNIPEEDELGNTSYNHNNKITFNNETAGMYRYGEPQVTLINNIMIYLTIDSGTILDEVTLFPVVNEGITAEPFYIG